MSNTTIPLSLINTKSTTLGQALLSNGAGLAPSWGVVANVNVTTPTPPTVAVTLTATTPAVSTQSSASGNLSGTYSYLVTYVTTLGETEAGIVSANITVGSTTPTYQNINITNIPISSNVLVTGRNIYRTISTNTSFYKLVTKLLDNSTTTYTDSTLDASLGVSVPYINTAGSILEIKNGVRVGIADTTTTVFGNLAQVANTAGYVTAIGSLALNSNTTGSNNTAVGYASLQLNTTGTNNTALGYAPLSLNTTGINNTAIGYQSLYSNTTGSSNVANGHKSLNLNATGINNTAIGYQSLLSNTASNNTAIGYNSLANNTTGTNSAVGYQSLANNTTGSSNTAIGYQSSYNNSTGNNNTALGHGSLSSNTIGVSNTSIGMSSLNANIAGSYNIAIGFQSLSSNTASNNTAIGCQSLTRNTTGSSNTTVGYQSLTNNTTATNNSALGNGSLQLNVTGNNNTAIGYQSLYNNTSASNAALGYLSLYNNTTGAGNTALGTQSLQATTTGANNIAIGQQAGATLTTGSNNVFLSANTVAGTGVTTGSGNTIIGSNVTNMAAAATNNIVISSGDGVVKALHDGTNWTFTGVVNASSAIVSGNVALATLTASGNATLATLTASGLAAFSGNATGVTATSGDSSSSFATTNFVTTASTAFKTSLAASTGAGLVGYQASGTGSVARTLQSKNQEIVSVKDFGAVGDGVTDDTAAFQAALNSGSKYVFIGPTTTSYLVGPLIMPTLIGFVLEGSGTSSMIKMKTGTIFSWPTGSVAYVQGYVKNIAIDGTNGSGHCIDTSNLGGMDFDDIYIKNIPTGYAGIRINGYTAGSVYSHDIAIRRPRIYDNGSGGTTGILCDAYAADVEINDPIINVNFITPYAIQFVAGCGSVQILGGHLYNAKTNIANIATAQEIIKFTGTTFDNANGDLIVANNAVGLLFDGCRLQSINSGTNGFNLVNCQNTKIIATAFGASGGAATAVTESGTTDYTVISNPDISSGSFNNFTTPFNLIGANSIVRGEYRNNLQGYLIPFYFCGTSNQGAGTTAYYGPNGQQTLAVNNQYVSPLNGLIQSCSVFCTNSPGTSQTYTITVAQNGTSLISGTISGASSYSVSLTVPAATSVFALGALTVSITSSSGAAVSQFRGVLIINA